MYKVVVYTPAERADIYTPPISPLPLFVLCVKNCAERGRKRLVWTGYGRQDEMVRTGCGRQDEMVRTGNGRQDKRFRTGCERQDKPVE
jgi:hypothetical protein